MSSPSTFQEQLKSFWSSGDVCTRARHDLSRGAMRLKSMRGSRALESPFRRKSKFEAIQACRWTLLGSSADNASRRWSFWPSSCKPCWLSACNEKADERESSFQTSDRRSSCLGTFETNLLAILKNTSWETLLTMDLWNLLLSSSIAFDCWLMCRRMSSMKNQLKLWSVSR